MRTPVFYAAVCHFAAGLLLLPTSHAAAQPPEAAPASAGDEAMVDAPFFKLGWPKVQMPKFSWKPGFGGDDDAGAPPTAPRENPVSKALDRVADSSRKASDSVRNAWGSAVSKISSLGRSGEPTTRVARDQQPSFWSRLFAPEEPEQARTVQEFLAQDRVGTTR